MKWAVCQLIYTVDYNKWLKSVNVQNMWIKYNFLSGIHTFFLACFQRPKKISLSKVVGLLSWLSKASRSLPLLLKLDKVRWSFQTYQKILRIMKQESSRPKQKNNSKSLSWWIQLAVHPKRANSLAWIGVVIHAICRRDMWVKVYSKRKHPQKPHLPQWHNFARLELAQDHQIRDIESFILWSDKIWPLQS